MTTNRNSRTKILRTLSAVLAAQAVVMLLAASQGHATVIANDSFDYTAGQLKGENGGTGFSGAWAGDNQPTVVVPGTLSYTDSLGNLLTTAGGQVTSSANNTKSVNRSLTSTYGSDGTTVWLSALIEGDADAKQTNIGLSDKFYVGQGNSSSGYTNWALYDAGARKYDSGISGVDNSDFLVVQIDFRSGAETAWLWVNPNLSSTPAKSAANNGLAGTSITSFTFNAVELYFTQTSDGFIDELRLGTAFADVAPYTAGNDSAITTSASQSFGRVMLGQTPTSGNLALNKTGSLDTTYAATPGNSGITVTADGSIAGGAQTENITTSLVNNANGSGSVGTRSWTIAVDNLATTSAGAGLGSADPNDSITVTATIVNNRDLSGGAAAVALGRVMINVDKTGASTIEGGSASDDVATRVNLNNGFVSSGGVTVTYSGGVYTFNGASQSRPVSVVGNFAATGLKSGSVNAAGLLSNGETSITGTPTVDSSVLINYTATAVDNRTVSSSAVNAGRIMLNQTGVSNLTTSGDDNNYTRVTVATTAAQNADGVSVTGGTGTTFNSAGSTGNRTLQFGATGAKSGNITLTTTSEGLTGESPIDVSINYSATVVGNRDLSQQGGPVALGKVLVGYNTATGSATITGGSADDDHATRVSLGDGNVTQNEVTVGGGPVFTFNGANQTAARDVTGNFSTSGAKNGLVNIAGQLSNADTVPGYTLDNTINVSFTAAAYEPAAVTVNNTGALHSGQKISIDNAAPAGSLRSKAVVDAIIFSNSGWTIKDMVVGTAIDSGDQLMAQLKFDRSDLLYGQTLADTLSIYMENEQDITGAANRDLNGGAAYIWNLEHHVAQSSGGSAKRNAGAPYDGLGATSNHGTDGMLLDGTASVAGTVTMSFSEAGTGARVIGDVLTLEGTDGDTIVLEMSYDEAELLAMVEPLSELEAAQRRLISLAFWNTDMSEWVNAVDENVGGTPNFILDGYKESYFSLGNYGVDIDNNRAWAVINHNSDFAILLDEVPVPEPSCLSLVALGLMALARRKRS